MVDTAPKSNPDFVTYILVVSPTDGLLKIEASGRPITSDPSSADTRSQYERVSEGLSNNYGTSTTSVGFLKTGSIWPDFVNFQMSLVKGDRKLLRYWLNPASGQQITAIRLSAEGSDRETVM